MPPRLRRVVFAYAINRLGTWFGVIALAVAVYDRTHSPIATAGLFLAAQLVPALLVPFVVTRLEASSRKGLISGLYLAEAIAFGVLAFLVTHLWLPAILLFVAADGIAALSATALLQTEAARLGAESKGWAKGACEDTAAELADLGVRKANAAMNTAFSFTFVVGPTAGGLLVAATNSSTALLVDVASFVCAAYLLVEVRSGRSANNGESLRAALAAAWQHMRHAPQLGRLLLVEGIALVFFEAIAPVAVVYAKKTLGAGDSGYGLLVGSWGVGAVFGGLIFSRSVRRPLGPLLTGGTLAVGAAYLGMAASPTLTLSCAAAVLGGIGNGVQWAALTSAVQRLTPLELHGRLMSAVQSVGAIAPAVGLSLGGALTAGISARGALWICGAGAASTTFAFVRVTRRGIPLAPAQPRRWDPPGGTAAQPEVPHSGLAGSTNP